MQISLVIAILGRFLIAYALVMCVPLLLAVFEGHASWRSLALSVVFTVFSGGILVWRGKINEHLGIREGFFIVVVGWILAAGYGALPYWLSGALSSYIDAFFETMSGLTTTGASVIGSLTIIPNSILLWRSITHWLGGMGIIVLFIVFLPHLGVGAFHLFKAEVPGPKAERVVPRIRDTAMMLWVIYTVLTITEVALLMLAGMSLFDAVNHAFATLATGGFSTKDASIKYFDSLAVELIIVLFMLLAGGNFALYYQAWRQGPRKAFRDTEFKLYLGIVALSVLIIAANLYWTQTEALGNSFRVSLFQVASIITTTGFATADFDKWPPLSKIILFFLMFIGGSAGSTAGGIKVSRFILLCKQGWIELKKSIHPRAVTSVHVDNKPVELTVLQSVMHFFFVFMLIYAVAVLIMAGTGLEPFDAMGAVAATLGNIGPAFGVVGPTCTYSGITPAGKVVLTLCMLLGRLELFTVLVLLRPEFWRPQKNW